MDTNQFKELKNTIRRHSKNMSQPPKKGETNRSQTERELESLRTERKKIAEQLVQEGYADSYSDAEVLINVMSPNLFEAISATKATVRALPVRGAAQQRMAKEDRRREAQKRAEERKAEREKELEYVQKRRENPTLLKKEAQRRTLSTRMERAAQRLGLD